MPTIHFNTGRPYTRDGQKITATRHDDGIVTFFDHSRMVHGQYVEVLPENFDKRSVMAVYDAGNHENTSRAWRDGMQQGGCNSKYQE